MTTSRLVSIVALMSTLSFASPIRNETELIERQASGLNCGGQQYTQQQAQDAWGSGINRRQTGNYVYYGSTPYPEEFRNGQAGNPEVDPSPCAGLQLYEFPILAGGADYNGGNPGPDRVVFADSNTVSGAYVQCFLMTHTGAQGNLFVKCS
ncbi:Ribonuclease/ribotoxin [Jackrogersella minutella]|nr:Ribonuclease/ribotoxin [Jackrogersella minutella]